MGSYVLWTLAAMLALVGFVLLLFVPGVAVLAAVALAAAIVMGIVLAIGRGGARNASLQRTSDIEERHAEHEQRRHLRRNRSRVR